MASNAVSKADSYSSNDFLADYKVFARLCPILENSTPEEAVGFLEALFADRYKGRPEMKRRRLQMFLKVLVTIEVHSKELIAAGYLQQFSTRDCSLVSDNLIRALHRLIIERNDDEEPTFQQIREAAEFFATRN